MQVELQDFPGDCLFWLPEEASGQDGRRNVCLCPGAFPPFDASAIPVAEPSAPAAQVASAAPCWQLVSSACTKSDARSARSGPRRRAPPSAAQRG